MSAPERETHVIVRCHEIMLKGRNRPFFINQLLENLNRAVAGQGVRSVRPAHNRIALHLEPGADWRPVAAAVQRVFGVENVSPAFRTRVDLDALAETVTANLDGRITGTFRIDTHRAWKQFPLNSEEINRQLGRIVQERTGAPVRLKGADTVITVEILPREAFVSFEKLPGPGGLPVGTGGRVVALLSGGIDSPVAAWRIMKRGCRVTFVHFHSYPFLDSSSRQKSQELVELLDRWQGDSRLYLVPIGEAQRNIVLNAPEPYRTLLYRRLMVRLAERIAQAEGALALVTGESLGQVASQTLEALLVIERVTPLPILRPLIGLDKTEIVAQAQAIGTYEVSILPDQDCCQLFQPRHPVTRPTLAAVEEAEAGLDLPQLVQSCLAEVELVEHGPQGRSKRQVSLAPDAGVPV